MGMAFYLPDCLLWTSHSGFAKACAIVVKAFCAACSCTVPAVVDQMLISRPRILNPSRNLKPPGLWQQKQGLVRPKQL